LRGRAVTLAWWTGVLLSSAAPSFAQQVLYGGNQYLQVESVNSGWFVEIDTATAAVTPIGHPADVARLVGLAFDADGILWAATLSGTPSGTLRSSMLITLDPVDGSIVEVIGPIVDSEGGEPVGLENLAIQPGTNVLLGTRGISDQDRVNAADIYRIDKTTGMATLSVNNNNGFQEASIAFAPDGTLYQSISTCCAPFGGNPKFQKLDPATGTVLSSVSIDDFFKAMAVREDGTLFAAVTPDIEHSDESEIYRIDPATGDRQLVGRTGHNPIGCLVFGPDALPPCALDDSCFDPRAPIQRPGAGRPSPRDVARHSP
jgi:sugar lactone lactonase YvrE